MHAERPRRGVPGRLALAGLLVFALGFALFVAVLREGRVTPGSVSAAWAGSFGLTLAATLGWQTLYVAGIAAVANRRVARVLVRALWSTLPLLAPVGLVLAAYASDDVNHILTRTDRLVWLWGTGVGLWVGLQIVTFVVALDQLDIRPWARVRSLLRAVPGAVATRLTFPLVLLQFVLLRVLLALLWRPWGFFERGSDVGAYEQRARLALRGLQPYLDYWVEYPPVFPWTASGLKLLSVHFGATEAAFQVLFGLLLVVFETGTLILIYRIVTRIWDEPRGLLAAVAYASLFYPIYIANRNFDGMAVFFLLLGVYALVEGRRHSATLALALGLLTKVFPVAGFPALLSGATLASRARYLAIALGVVGGALLPLALVGRDFFVASITNMALRPGWETVWALADGYFSFGWIHRFRESTDTAIEFNYVPDLPAVVWPAAAIVLLAFYAFLALRRWPQHPALSVWMSGAALAAFGLYLKGWSPQFMVWLLPFVIIAYPGGRGYVLATGLSGLALLEWPAYFTLWSDRPWVLWVIVIVRSLALLALGVMFTRRLFALEPRQPGSASNPA